MRITFAILPLLHTTAALAAEEAPEKTRSNIFNANLSNPDLALAVSQFEETCMPFVLHKTEMPQKQNVQHHTNLMESRSFAYQSSETLSMRVEIEPARQEWKPPSNSKFTIYNGLADPATESTMTIVNHTGEIDMLALVPAIYKTVTSPQQTYNFRSDSRLTTILSWNYPSQNHPGKSCSIKLNAPKISQSDFTSVFIEKDRDWIPSDSGWKQCVRDGEDEFEFTAQRNEDALSLHIKRNDFYAPDICTEKTPKPKFVECKLRIHPGVSL